MYASISDGSRPRLDTGEIWLVVDSLFIASREAPPAGAEGRASVISNARAVMNFGAHKLVCVMRH